MKPHLAPPTPPNHLSKYLQMCLNINTSFHHMTSPSIDPPHHVSSPSIDTSFHHLSHQSVNTSVSLMTSPSIDPSIHHVTSLPIDPSIHHVTCPSVNPSVHPVLSLSDCPSMSNCLYAIFTSPSDYPSICTSLSDCPSPSDHLSKTMTHPSACLSSVTTKHLHDSTQSLAVMNGSNPASTRYSVGPLLTMTYFYML